MPLFYQHNINAATKLGVWHIAESEDFFLSKVPLQQEIRHPHKRLQHLAGRYLLRFLFPEFPNELIAIAETRKPFLPDEAFHFSISHCGDYAAAIVSRLHRVGIDIEIPTDKVARVSHKFLHVNEKDIIPQLSEGQVDVADVKSEPFIRYLTLLWSAKEAVYKWYGNGEVSFKEQIQVQIAERSQPLPERGAMKGTFLKDGILPLKLPFVNFKDICLVWVVTQ